VSNVVMKILREDKYIINVVQQLNELFD